MFRVKPLVPSVPLPARQTDGSAGYDMHSVEAHTVDPGCRVRVPTGMAIAVPSGHAGVLKTRSSMALVGIDVCGGVIDSDYTGEVSVILHNTSDVAYSVKLHQRIAQLLIVPVFTAAVQVVEDLEPTARGADGFGSTGV